MNDIASQHPDRDTLVAFARGQLDPKAGRQVERHVEQCGSCCEILSSVPDDTLANRLRYMDTVVSADGSQSATDTAPDDPTAIPPELNDHPRYRILQPLGRGGMGAVYKAEHRLMDRIVALKVINQKFIDHPQAVERFRNEVRAAARLSHPNIVSAFDAEQEGDLHFLVMEYVDGISLDQLVRQRGPLPPEQACGVIRKVAHGLQHASEQGMVHRDIKPQNIMVTRAGKVRVLDFGLARLGRETRQTPEAKAGDIEDLLQRTADALTLAGSVLGTPDYIAPEQVLDSHSADTRADIYSLGCTLYFLLAGHPPYPDGSVMEKLSAHCEGEPPDISRAVADVPAELVAVIRRMTARDPDERFSTPGDVAKALDGLAKAGPSPAVPAEVDVPESLRERAAARSARRANRRREPEPETIASEIPTSDSLAAHDDPSDTDLDAVAAPLPARQRRTSLQRKNRRRGASSGIRMPHLIMGGIACAAIGIGAFLIDRDAGDSADVPNNGSEGSTIGEVQPPDVSEGRPPDDGEVDLSDNGGAGGAAPVDGAAVSLSVSARVLIVIPHRNFWYPDYGPLKDVLESGGAEVTTASSSTDLATAHPDGDGATDVLPDVLLADVRPDEFDAIAFIGQWQGSKNNFRNEYTTEVDPTQAQIAHDLIHGMAENNRLVTAICGGINVLADSRILDGRQTADNEFIRPHFKAQTSIDWTSGRRIVEDGNIVTASEPSDAEVFGQALLNRFRSE